MNFAMLPKLYRQNSDDVGYSISVIFAHKTRYASFLH